MKRIVKVVFVFVVVVFSLLLWDELSRKFYCLDNNKCITIWKTSWGCYIIPGKYYGVIKPSDCYIKSRNDKYLTLYFSSNIPNRIIVRDQGSFTGKKGGYEIVNNIPEILEIVEYSNDYKTILYRPEATKFRDVKSTTDYLTVNIKENYAIDKSGKKLK